MNARAYGIAALGAILLLGFSSVAANYSDGFDSYSNGNKSPASCGNPWCLSYSSVAYSDCFNSGMSQTGVFSYVTTGALSPPNVYEFAGLNNATCFGGTHSATLSITLNATQPHLTFSFYDQVLTGGSNSTYVMTAIVCGAPTTVPTAHTTPYWHLVNITVLATHPCTASFTLQTTTSSPAAVNFQIDNVKVTGANAVFSAANYFMYNLHSGQLYNISSYADSYLTVKYPTGPSYYLQNLTAPDLELPLAFADLVTECVTAAYCPSFIPPSAGDMNVYMVLPSQALSVLITIASPSNVFPAGSVVNITQGDKAVGSGYLDGSHQFTAFLSPGQYSLTVTFGSLVYTTTILVSEAATQFTIPILGLSGSGFTNGAGSLGYNAGWDSALLNVVWYFQDQTNTTTYLLVQLIRTNGSGTIVVQSTTLHGAGYGYASGSFSCAADGCNSTLSPQLAVRFVATNEFGALTPYGPVSVATSGQGICVAGLCVPPDGNLGGLSEFFPGVNYLQLGAFFALIMMGSAFGEVDAPLGAVVMVIMSAFLVFIGALPLPSIVTASLGVVAILSFVDWREKRSQNPYG